MSQRNANDTPNTSLTGHEQVALTRYGSLPIQSNLLRAKERKFFDSGDFALSNATKDSVTGHQKTGKEHPRRESVAHLSSPIPSDSNLKVDANASHKLSTTSPMEVVPPSPLTDHHSHQCEIGTSKSTRADGVCAQQGTKMLMVPCIPLVVIFYTAQRNELGLPGDCPFVFEEDDTQNTSYNSKNGTTRENLPENTLILMPPRQNGCPNDLGNAPNVNQVQDKTDTPTIQSQQHEVCSNGLSGIGRHPKRRAGVNRHGSFSQAKDENSKSQTIDSGGVSVKIAKDSILGVGGWWETDQGTEYRCLILAWLREDRVPNKKIQEYDNHVARSRRRKSLRKREREYSPDGDDEGKRMLKKMRGRE